jgi:hypothetical protein
MSEKGLQQSIEARFAVSHGTLSAPQGSASRDISKLSASYQKLWMNLEYASQFPPFSQGTGCLGRIDYSKELEDRSVVVRGWLFHYRYRIKSLYLSCTHVSVRVHVYKLLRTDVEAHFKHLPCSRNCGFMAVFPSISFAGDRNLKTIEFVARLEDGTVQRGNLILFNE